MSEFGCDECVDGWRQVVAGYGAKVHPGPSESELARFEPEVRAVVEAGTVAMQESLDGSVYPCKTCNPRAFHRWRGGHWRSDHNRADCEECNPKAAKKLAGRSGVMDPPPHSDEDAKSSGYVDRERADLR